MKYSEEKNQVLTAKELSDRKLESVAGGNPPPREQLQRANLQGLLGSAPHRKDRPKNA